MTNQSDLTTAANAQQEQGAPEQGSGTAQDMLVGETVQTPVATLRQRLLTTVVPIALAPLVVASVIGYTQTEAQVKAKALLQLEEVSLLTSEASTIFLKDALKIPDLAASSSVLLKAVQDAEAVVAAEGLAQKPIEVLEKQFAGSKVLKPNPDLNQYLKRVAKNGRLAEIFVTDKNGFNVGFSTPTSDFVQNDESWWQMARNNGQFIDEPEFDQSSQTQVIAIAKQIKNDSGQMIGVIKAGLPTQELDEAIRTLITPNLSPTEVVQIVDPKLETNQLVDSISKSGNDTQTKDVIGGADVLAAANLLEDYLESSELELATVEAQIKKIPGIKDLNLTTKTAENFELLVAAFTYKDRFYNLSFVPDTKLVAIASVETSEEAAIAQNLALLFLAIAVALGVIVVIVITRLSKSLSSPLAALTATAETVASGNLDVQAEVQGTREARTLAQSFNALVSEVKDLLDKQELATQEEQEARDKLEMAIFQLMDEVGDATEGDLTVRANLDSLELSTIADLFNAIIDNLNDIALQVKTSSAQVSTALDENGEAISTLAEQAESETQQTRTTLQSVAQMSESIEDVAANASKAASISDEAYSTVQEGSAAMDQTVDSIVSLRNTVGETAKKIKRLGESSQKISQVVSLIEEIALKTNLLAINASVEASRAGEQGQGFTVVAEQVGALAEQSAAATKQIAQLVAGIQTETKSVTEAMEVGTNQVVDSTRLVENTKEKLAVALSSSQQINNLMRTISDATVSQAETSKAVTLLMEQMSQVSEVRSHSSSQVAQSMQETAAIAKKLEAAVDQFKLEAEAV